MPRRSAYKHCSPSAASRRSACGSACGPAAAPGSATRSNMPKRSCRAASPSTIRTRRAVAAAANPFTSDELSRVKLFQIEEPDGGPADADAPGAAIGIDASGSQAEVAFSVGGNALVLSDREGYVRALPVPAIAAPTGEWQLLLEGARIRAERVLARPITHVVIVLAATPDGGSTRHLLE